MRLTRLGSVACGLTLAGAMLALPGAGPAPAAALGRFGTPQPGMRAGAPDGPCAGAIEVRTRTGPVSCTHGPDPAPPGIDIRRPRQPDPVASGHGVARAEGAAPVAPICTGNGTDGPRVQLVYARPAGSPDRYGAFAASFQRWAAEIDDGIRRSAAETAGFRRIRFVHDATCTPTISRVVVSTAAITEFGTFNSEIRGSSTDRRFLVWMDANQYCGIAEFMADDTPGMRNRHQEPWALVSRVDSGCWGIPGELAEAHEFMHTLGAVQQSAPHSTGAGLHCTDEIDRMCGVDGYGAVVTTPCPAGREDLFDCDHDDYFHTDPAPGSYLATHWNSADSHFLAQPPQAPQNVQVFPAEGSATVTWSAPFDGGFPITEYRLSTNLDGAAGPVVTPPATARSHTVTGLPDGYRVVFTLSATNGYGVGAKSAPSTPATASDGSRFHPLAPVRILDTRTGDGAPMSPVGGYASIDVQITGRVGVPASGVSAVVLNVTVTEPFGPGFLTAWPAGESRPLASNLNFGPGQTVANLVTVKVGAGGRVSVFNGAFRTHVIADVAGWYGPSAAADGSRFHALAPARILDTRAGNGAAVGRVGAPTALDVQVAGRGGVPATGASAVVLNLTVTDPMTGGYLTAWPTGAGRPMASNLNFLPGETVPNLVTVKLGAGGKVSLFTSAGLNGGFGGAHMVADVAGWFGPDGESSGARYHPVVPARFLDTRDAATTAPTVAPVAVAVAANGTIELAVTGRGGVAPTGVSAVILNVTVVEPGRLGFLTVWPTGSVRPLASNLNFVSGQTTPNLVVAKVGADGKVSLYNGSAGTAHLVVDIAGWYGPE